MGALLKSATPPPLLKLVDRLTPIVDFKARREARASRSLREAVDVEQRQREAVEARRSQLARERTIEVDAALSCLSYLDDAHDRQPSSATSEPSRRRVRLSTTFAATTAPLSSSGEHRALLRLQDRRRAEARQHAERREQRALDELAMR